MPWRTFFALSFSPWPTFLHSHNHINPNWSIFHKQRLMGHHVFSRHSHYSWQVWLSAAGESAEMDVWDWREIQRDMLRHADPAEGLLRWVELRSAHPDEYGGETSAANSPWAHTEHLDSAGLPVFDQALLRHTAKWPADNSQWLPYTVTRSLTSDCCHWSKTVVSTITLALFVC